MSVSGLGYNDRIKCRDMAMQAGYLSLHHKERTHYTQDAILRWEGIHRNMKAWRGEYPTHGDCSSTATWWLWCGLSHWHIRDVVNGLDWKAGYTGTQLRHGKSVHLKDAIRGDLVIYGTSAPGEHVAMYVGGGRVISHGSEGGPYLLEATYRRDILAVHRYI